MRFGTSSYEIKVNALAVEMLLDTKNHLTLQPDPRGKFLGICSQTALFLLFLSLCEKCESYDRNLFQSEMSPGLASSLFGQKNSFNCSDRLGASLDITKILS